MKSELSCLQQFHYRLSQLQRIETAPTLSIPASDHPDAPAPPPAHARLEERLGKRGGTFTLNELAEWLLSPLRPHGLQPTQSQLNVYCVVRFGSRVSFVEDATRDRLAPLAAALSQVEESTHVGLFPDAGSPVPDCFIKRNHWASVGLLGCANLIADQDPAHAFDQQRLPVV